jgi:hypothetical protein
MPSGLRRHRPHRKKPLATKQFGRLQVLRTFRRQRNGVARVYVRCLCRCGRRVTTRRESIERGHSRSCGCLQREIVSRRGELSPRFKHGHASRDHKSPEYKCWMGMYQNCYNRRRKSFQYYGGSGISVSERWRGEHGFEQFFADLGLKPEPHELFCLARYDTTDDFAPGNCRWALRSEFRRHPR